MEEIVLDVSQWRRGSLTYYRILIPKKMSDALGLTRGSKIKVEVKEVLNSKSNIVEQRPLGNPNANISNTNP